MKLKHCITAAMTVTALIGGNSQAVERTLYLGGYGGSGEKNIDPGGDNLRHHVSHDNT